MGSVKGLMRREKVLNGTGEFLREKAIGFLDSSNSISKLKNGTCQKSLDFFPLATF